MRETLVASRTPPSGDLPATQACALTRNGTGNILVSRLGVQSTEPHQPGLQFVFLTEEETRPRITHMVSDRNRTNRSQVTSLGVFPLRNKVKFCHSWRVWGHPACSVFWGDTMNSFGVYILVTEILELETYGLDEE